ncbi:hypothetical protein CCHR01_19980 [Colletotrichum chrysophilum]|uniref:Uncharacterized protein n=1 Tax=Colletotrichum chrysophilum TaxID=1836956 RepID=A0AAD8ZYQ7_9PEZI|nr:hypothetical protein CCHR01_19980 [Colletotrichum chrysophilum]
MKTASTTSRHLLVFTILSNGS